VHTTETATDLHPAGSADSAPPRRIQRRREITRERLIAVAVELFATRGYDQTSMEIIAAEADVARTTVFNHFARKDELLRAGLAGRRDLVADRLRSSRGTLSTKARIDDALERWAAGYQLDAAKGVALVRAWIQAGGPHLADAAATADLLSEVMRDGQLAGEVRADISSETAGLVLFDCAVGALVRWGSPVAAGRPSDLAAAMRRSVDLAMVGMLVQPD
jgi:AcrR family transcriptional regulator